MRHSLAPWATLALAVAAVALAGAPASAGPICSTADAACMDHVDDPQPLINDAAPGMVNEGAGAPAGALPKPAMKVLRAKPPAIVAPAPAMAPPPLPAETDKPELPPPAQ